MLQYEESFFSIKFVVVLINAPYYTISKSKFVWTLLFFMGF